MPARRAPPRRRRAPPRGSRSSGSPQPPPPVRTITSAFTAPGGAPRPSCGIRPRRARAAWYMPYSPGLPPHRPHGGYWLRRTSSKSHLPSIRLRTRMSIPSPPRYFPAPPESARSAALDQHRAFELDPFDRAVAHVALDTRKRCRTRRPRTAARPSRRLRCSAPRTAAWSRDACRRTRRPRRGARGVPPAPAPPWPGRAPRDDGIDHHGHDHAPGRHRRGKARHHDVALGNDHLERAERASLTGSSGAVSAL